MFATIYSTKLVRQSSVKYGKANGSIAAGKIVANLLADSPSECLVVVFLDTKLTATGAAIVSTGTLDTALAHPREIFRPAILANASAIILAHNHPSGDSTPSKQDYAVFERCKLAGEQLGITVLDSIVVAYDDDAYSTYSMLEQRVVGESAEAVAEERDLYGNPASYRREALDDLWFEAQQAGESDDYLRALSLAYRLAFDQSDRADLALEFADYYAAEFASEMTKRTIAPDWPEKHCCEEYRAWIRANGEYFREEREEYLESEAERFLSEHASLDVSDLMTALDRSNRLRIGSRVTAGEGEDNDSGRIDDIVGDQITVAWDSGVVTTQSARALQLAIGVVGVTQDWNSGITDWEFDDGSFIRIDGSIVATVKPRNPDELAEEREEYGNPANNLVIRNDYTGRQIIVDTRRPLTARKIKVMRSNLHAADCTSGDELGGRGKQADPEAYESFLLRAQRVITTGYDETDKLAEERTEYQTSLQLDSREYVRNQAIPQFSVGDQVAFSANWLKSIGAFTGNIPQSRGIVRRLERIGSSTIATIDWNSAHVPARVNCANLAHVGPNSAFCACEEREEYGDDNQLYSFTDAAGEYWLLIGPAGPSWSPAKFESERFLVAGEVNALSFQAWLQNYLNCCVKLVRESDDCVAEEREEYAAPRKLLATNTKLDKELTNPWTGNSFAITGLTLAPHRLSGYNVCAGSSIGCRAACNLWFSGQRVTPQARSAAIRATRFLFANPAEFYAMLHRELAAFIRHCERLQLSPLVRLNVASDLAWSHVIASWPHVQFYDYTKIRSRFAAYLAGDLPENYALTFSRHESHHHATIASYLRRGGNLAQVFDVAYHPQSGTYGALPQSVRINGKLWQVVDGDQHDVRLPYIDGRGVIVGLRLKGTNAAKQRARKLGFAFGV